MLPIPYGLLTNELIEVIDMERVMPGITWIGKFGEDFPFLDHHSTLKEKQAMPNSEPSQPNKPVVNPHQHIHTTSSGSTRSLLKSLSCSKLEQ
jgi:hypothetical protein